MHPRCDSPGSSSAQRRHPAVRVALAALAALALAVPLALPMDASAQMRTMRTTPASFPTGLTWHPLKEVTFNAVRVPAAQQATPVETKKARAELEPYWRDQIALAAQRKFPVSILYGGTPELTFSVANSLAFVDWCDQPGNGRGMQDQYALCPAKVILHARSGPMVANFERFCHLYLDDSANPLADNHTEFAFDLQRATLYTRVIQYGRPVPACNRAVRFG